MRRRKQADDSLELLLDTICNTFGGIVFIAVLVVILLRQSSHRLSDPERPSDPTPAAFERLTAWLDQARSEQSALQATAFELSRLRERFDTEVIRNLHARNRALGQDVEELRKQRDDLALKNAARATELSSRRQKLDQLEAAIRQARSDQERLERELQDARARAVDEARTPLLTDAGLRQPIGAVLQYDRLYLIHRYDGDGRRVGANLDHFVILGDEGDAAIVAARPEAGVPVRDDAESRAAVRRLLAAFPANRFYLDLVVRTDSFDTFRFLQRSLTATEHRYRLIPTDDGVFDSGGSDGRVQ